MSTYISSAICPQCKTGYVTEGDKGWICNNCDKTLPSEIISYKVQCCSDKLDAISKFFLNKSFKLENSQSNFSTVRTVIVIPVKIYT